MFGASSGGFGTTQAQSGTAHTKYAPVIGSDMMMKNGLQQNVQTRHQCITAMKQYEAKSFEELRVDDYLANRKGPQAGASTGFGASSSAAKPSTGFSFGSQQSTASTNLFGSSSTAKPAFGGASTNLFGSNTNTNTGGGLFGGAAKPFGTATTSTGGFGGFGSTATSSTGTSLFGGQQKTGGLFGGTSTSTTGGGLFGSSTNTGFGATSTGGFGATSAGGFGGGNNLFGNKTTGFGTTTTASTGFGTGGSSLFGNSTAAKPTTSLFGASSTGFGTSNTGGGLFGGGAAKTGFGTTTNTGGLFGGTNAFGATNNQQKPGGLFGGSSFGATNNTLGAGGGGFNFGASGFNPGGGTNTSQSLFGNTAANNVNNTNNPLVLPSATNEQTALMVQALLTAPFGDSPLFKNDLSDVKRKEKLKPTNPIAHKAVIQSPVYRISTTGSKLKPRARSSTPSSQNGRHLFAGLEPEDNVAISNSLFVPRSSVKKLNKHITITGNTSLPTPRHSPASSAYAGSLNNGSNKEECDLPELAVEPTKVPQLVDTPVIRKIPVPAEDSYVNGSIDDTHAALDIPTTSNNNDDKEPTLDTTSFNGSNSAVMSESNQDSAVREDEGEPHPAGIKLTKVGYKTEPTLQQMKELTTDDGVCKVNNFLIKRDGYGSVYFEGEVNLTGIDLDDIVHIRRKEVILYPDDDNKPPLGEGLNRPAEITLECVWPTDKSTREPVTDLQRLINMGWEKKLETSTMKMGARFKEYRPETGSWVFEVAHFSKYGLAGSDDEADEENQPPNKPKPKDKVTPLKVDKVAKPTTDGTKPQLWSARIEKEAAQQPPQSPVEEEIMTFQNNDVTQDMNDDDGDEETYLSPRAEFVRNPTSQKMQIMKASFFADDDDDFTPKRNLPTAASAVKGLTNGISSRLNDSSLKNLSFTQSPIVKRSVQVVNRTPTQSPAVEFMTPEAETNDDINDDTGDPPTMPPTPLSFKQNPRKRKLRPRQRPRTMIPPVRKPSVSYQSRREPSNSFYPDAACILTKSFRVGWGPNWTLVHSGQTTDENAEKVVEPQQGGGNEFLFKHQPNDESSKGYQVTMERIHSTSTKKEPQLSTSDLPYLQTALSHSTFSNDEDKTDLNATSLGTQPAHLPLIQPVGGHQLLDEFANIGREALQNMDADNEDDSATAQLCHLAFSLCDALWGRLKLDDGNDIITDDRTNHSHQRARKRMLISWLIKAIELDDDDVQMLPDDPMEKILHYVQSGDFETAVNTALLTGNSNLALLLAQSTGDVEVRLAVGKQLNEWEESGADMFMSEATLKIYALLAGKPIWLGNLGNKFGMINTCAGLDWKRCLLMHLLFLTEPVSSVETSMALYQLSFTDDGSERVYGVRPYPLYMKADDCQDDTLQDICYHLLHIYCERSHRFETSLSPLTCGPYPLDYRISWTVWRVLQSAGYINNMTSQSVDRLHVSYAAQLDARGLWQYAVFVLMHVKNYKKRESMVKQLIGRHIQQDKTDQEEFLTDDLGVPSRWIHEARALHSLYNNQQHSLAEQLLLAQHWRMGHDVIMKHVAAEALIQGERVVVEGLLDTIDDHNRSVPNWNGSGKVYLDYFHLEDKIQQLKSRDIPGTRKIAVLEELKPEITSLCHRVADLKCLNVRDRLARAEISQKTISLQQTMDSLARETDKTSLVGANVAQQVTRIHLPDDYTLHVLSDIVEQHNEDIHNV